MCLEIPRLTRAQRSQCLSNQRKFIAGIIEEQGPGLEIEYTFDRTEITFKDRAGNILNTGKILQNWPLESTGTYTLLEYSLITGSWSGNKSSSHTLTVASDTMAEDRETTKSAEMESEKSMSTTGKDQARKSKEIAITLAWVQKETLTVTPANQKINKREQKLSKKKQVKQKRTMKLYLGGGARVQPPSKGGTPVQSIFMQCLTKVATVELEGQKHILDQNNNEEKGKETKAACKAKDSTTKTAQLLGQQHSSYQNNKAEKGKEAEAEEPEVDLEGFTTGLRHKGQGYRKKGKKRREESKTEEQVKQTEARKPEIAFV
jgi:hypothetical protein